MGEFGRGRVRFAPCAKVSVPYAMSIVPLCLRAKLALVHNSSTEPCANKVHRSQTPRGRLQTPVQAAMRLLRATLLVAAACSLQLPTRKHMIKTNRYATRTDETPAQLAEERRTWRRRKRSEVLVFAAPPNDNRSHLHNRRATWIAALRARLEIT